MSFLYSLSRSASSRLCFLICSFVFFLLVLGYMSYWVSQQIEVGSVGEVVSVVLGSSAPFLFTALCFDKGRQAFFSLGSRLLYKDWKLLSLAIVSILLFSWMLEVASEGLLSTLGLESWIEDPSTTHVRHLLDELSMPTLLIIIAVLPALAEELFFRAILQSILLELLGVDRWYLAILFASIIFSAIHLSLVGFLPRVAMGYILGYSYYKSGSKLSIPILIHCTNNVFFLLSIV